MKHRVERVAKLVKKVVGETLLEEMPGNVPIINNVTLSPDLRHATVWILPSEEEQEEMLAELDEHKAAIQKELGEQLQSKFTPKVIFRIDEAARRAERIDDLLDSL